MNRKIVCVSCPAGCEMEVTEEGGKVKNISGNNCKRGIAYAKSEIEDPKRMLTTTVRVKNGAHPLLPVRTSRPIPKAMLLSCMKELNGVAMKAPVGTGDVIIPDILHTGADIIATRPVARI